VLLPLAQLGDRLRAAPVRQLAATAQRLHNRPGTPHLAMVGMLKPSLHFYGRRVVVYEEAGPQGLVNLSDRLAGESRPGQIPSPADGRGNLLLVIDAETAAQPHWQGLEPERLDQASIYRLWRLDRRRLEQRAAALRLQGWQPNWREPRPERY
jgi:hypothetical protein